MPPLDPRTVRMTTFCVFKLCLGYRARARANLTSADSSLDFLSASIVISATFLLVCFVVVLFFVLWEIVLLTAQLRRELLDLYTENFGTSTVMSSGRVRGDNYLSVDEEEEGNDIEQCVSKPDEMRGVLHLFDRLDDLSPLMVVTHTGDDKNEENCVQTICECGHHNDQIHMRIDRCAVCLEDVEPRQVARRLICRHVFHARCIDRWVMQVASGCDGSGTGLHGVRCPLCKVDVVGVNKDKTKAEL